MTKMDKTNFSKLIQKAKTFEELETLKEGFLAECRKQYDRISVSILLESINSFGDVKTMFESIVPTLLGKKNGKNLINQYVKVIKENKTLKTLYAYHEGLNKNITPETKKNYITEALSIKNDFNTKDYNDGIKEIVGIISEGFKLIGDEQVLNLIKLSDINTSVNESIDFLASTPKTVKNLNDYINHINIVSESTQRISDSTPFDVDVTLDEMLDRKVDNESSKNVVESIFDKSVDKEQTFKKTKDICLNMIKEQRNLCKNPEVSQKLDEMASKLNKKTYNYDTYTKDMLFMSELQEVLN